MPQSSGEGGVDQETGDNEQEDEHVQHTHETLVHLPVFLGQLLGSLLCILLRLVHGQVCALELFLVLLDLKVGILLHAQHLLDQQVSLVHCFHLFGFHVLPLLQLGLQREVPLLLELLLRQLAREQERVVLPGASSGFLSRIILIVV